MRDKVDLQMENIRDEYFPNWEEVWDYSIKDRRPFFPAVEESLFFMTKNEPEIADRTTKNSRFDALHAPTGYEPQSVGDENPLVNWLNYKMTPDRWNFLLDEFYPGDDNAVIHYSNLAKSLGRKNNENFLNYLTENRNTVLINPFEVNDVLNNKLSTYKHFKDDLPVVPTLEADEFYERELEELESVIGNINDKLDGEAVGCVLKPKKGSKGKGVIRARSWEEVRETLELEANKEKILAGLRAEEGEEGLKEKARNKYVIQPFIPHDSDVRIQVFGEKVGNAYRRKSPSGDFRTNLNSVSSLINGEDYSVYGETVNALRNERIEPLDVGLVDRDFDSEFNSNKLSHEMKDLGKSAARTFEPEEFNYNPDLHRKPLYFSIDVVEADEESIDHLPSDLKDSSLRYSDGIVPFIVEGNNWPGTVIDVAARWSGNPEQISALQLYGLMEDISIGASSEIESVVGDYSDRVWRRIGEYYPAFDSHDVSTELE